MTPDHAEPPPNTRLDVTRALAILCAAWMLAGAVRAQERVRKGDFEIGMGIGWAGFDAEVVEPNGTRFSAHGGYFLTGTLELEGDITCLGGNERAPSDSPTFTLCTGSIGGTVDLPLRADLVPYVRLSVGQAQLDRGAAAGVFDIDERSAALQAGAGSRFYFGKRQRFAVRVDASWLRTGVFEKWSTHASVAVGVSYRIGRTP